MQKITPCLWFNKDAEAAVKLYTSIIPKSNVGSITHYGKEGFEIHHMPEGTVLTINFTLGEQPFLAMNGGPAFTFNPSISFHIKCETAAEVDALWAKLSPEGKVLMELGEYPFSKRYGWLEDKYGVSWQVIYAGDQPFQQKIVPALLYVGSMCGRAEEAVNFYASLFKNSKVNTISRYGKGMEPDKETSVNYAGFTLAGQEFIAMESAREHKFTFNEAISFEVDCQDQEEVDYFWNAFTTDGGQESMCGWLKDKFGVSWQIVPKRLGQLLGDKDPIKSGRVMTEMLKMKKIIVKDLEAAYNEKTK